MASLLWRAEAEVKVLTLCPTHLLWPASCSMPHFIPGPMSSTVLNRAPSSACIIESEYTKGTQMSSSESLNWEKNKLLAGAATKA